MGRYTCFDPYGKEFESEKAMTESYKISYMTYRHRKKLKWGLKECLGLDGRGLIQHVQVVKDHLGNEFSSRKAMCKEYGIDAGTFKCRKELGWTLRECLGIDKHGIVTDPFGKEFSNEAEMARYHGVKKSVYYSRKLRGDSLEKCLGLSENKFVSDPFGAKFESERAMARHYKVGTGMYKARKRYGWTLRECLGIDRHSECIVDMYGNNFNNDKELANKYGINVEVYKSRKKYNWNMSECLGVSGRGLDAKIIDDISINNLLSVSKGYTTNEKDDRRYFKVTVLATDEIKYMNSDQIKAYPNGWKTLQCVESTGKSCRHKI